MQLIPIADLANHVSTGAILKQEPDGSYIFRAPKALRAGESFYASYVHTNDIRCDDQWLGEYGFLPGEDRTGAVCLDLPIVLNMHRLSENKRNLWTQLDASLHRTYKLMRGGIPHVNTLTAARIAVATEAQVEQVQRMLANTSPPTIDWRLVPNLNETEAVMLLKLIVRTLIQSNWTTIEDDEQMLTNNKLSDTARLSIRCRMREKILLQKALGYGT